MPLFERGPLEQETGLLKERWAQDGSVVVNIGATFTAADTLYTVTAGTKLFVKTLVVQQNNTTSGQGLIKDSSSGDALATVRIGATAGQNVVVNFDTPLVFETEVYVTVWSSANFNVTISGWEERI